MTHPASPSPKAGSPAQCSRCGAPLAAHQRYCLNCGARVAESRVPYETLLRATSGKEPVLAPVLAAAPLAVGPRTLSPLGAAAGIGLLLFAVLVGATIGGRENATAQPVVLAQSTTPAATTATVAAFTSDWSGGDGWTVQLQVLPKSGTTPQQIADAKAAATAAGATEVGALDTTIYPTLPPDSYVIYSGRYADKAAAKAGRKALTPMLPEAKLAEVATAGATGTSNKRVDKSSTPADKATNKALEDLKKSSSEDYVKKSKKLPDEVGTDGEAAPVDDAAPGGGSDEAATEIG